MDVARRAQCAGRREERAELRREEATALATRHQEKEQERREERAAFDTRWREADAHDKEVLGDLERRVEDEHRRHQEVLRLLEEERRVEEATRTAAAADRIAARERLEKRHAADRAAEQREWARHQREHQRQQEYDDEEATMLAQVESEHAFYVQKAAALERELAGEQQKEREAREKREKLASFERRTDDLLLQRRMDEERKGGKAASSVPAADAVPAASATSPKMSSPYSAAYSACGTAGAYLGRTGAQKRTTERLGALGLLERIDRQIQRNTSGGGGCADSFGRDVEDPSYKDHLKTDETTVWTEEALRAEFNGFDKDNNGFLERNEVMPFFKKKCADRGIDPRDIPSWERLKVIIGRSDPMQIAHSNTSDDKLDFNEFCLLLLWLAKR